MLTEKASQCRIWCTCQLEPENLQQHQEWYLGWLSFRVDNTISQYPTPPWPIMMSFWSSMYLLHAATHLIIPPYQQPFLAYPSLSGTSSSLPPDPTYNSTIYNLPSFHPIIFTSSFQLLCLTFLLTLLQSWLQWCMFSYFFNAICISVMLQMLAVT